MRSLLALSVILICTISPALADDSIATARELEFDKPFDVQLEPRMDVDFFKFTAPSNGVVNWSWSGELVGHRMECTEGPGRASIRVVLRRCG